MYPQHLAQGWTLEWVVNKRLLTNDVLHADENRATLATVELCPTPTLVI